MSIRTIKKFFIIALMTIVSFTIISCSKKSYAEMESESRDIFNFEKNVDRRGIAVAYFSVDDDVKEVAEKFKEAIDADIFAIEAAVPYTEADLDFNNKDSRVKLEDEFNPFDRFAEIEEEEYETSEGIVIATKSTTEERKRITELPKIKQNSANSYPIIVLGFPVWYENAPKVIYTFMQGLKNKIVVPFCTGKDMGMIDQFLSNITDDSVRVMSGRRFDKDVSLEEIKEWMAMLSADFDA